ncbi:hypothetical protein BX600DRAFT_461265 [Xylariales sp. PMI_506]|nr:hypothetical protein BX600DRAFT_461265 [Xylariales sp. PMI_506]
MKILSMLPTRIACLVPLLLAIGQHPLGLVAAVEFADGEQPQRPVHSEPTPKHHAELPVLGYVTPWHSRGKDLVEKYRHKFDLVSPVWYTVHATPGDDAHPYQVRGGPPVDEDKDWYQRLQQAESGKPLKIIPRFMLDDWKTEDYRAFAFNETKWDLLTETIMTVLHDMSYDGMVFESAATRLIPDPLLNLAQALHDADKLLVLVLPPSPSDTSLAQDAEMQETTQRAFMETLEALAGIPDYFSVMTYDMSGPSGRIMNRAWPKGTDAFSAAKMGRIREPGPNSDARWVRNNMIALHTLSLVQHMRMGQSEKCKGACKGRLEHSKFLMGLPLYGYTYPIFFTNSKTGVAVPSPVPGVTWAQYAVPILRGAGEAIIMPAIQDLIEKHKPEVHELENEGESYFDYEQDDGLWRVFYPSPKSMGGILDLLSKDLDDPLDGITFSRENSGAALWEVGQATEDLLETL